MPPRNCHPDLWAPSTRRGPCPLILGRSQYPHSLPCLPCLTPFRASLVCGHFWMRRQTDRSLEIMRPSPSGRCVCQASCTPASPGCPSLVCLPHPCMGGLCRIRPAWACLFPRPCVSTLLFDPGAGGAGGPAVRQPCQVSPGDHGDGEHAGAPDPGLQPLVCRAEEDHGWVLHQLRWGRCSNSPWGGCDNSRWVPPRHPSGLHPGAG